MKKEEQKNQEKEKKLKITSFSLKRKQQLKSNFIWWGWKTT
ncbi:MULTISPECIES: hypothetical protein [unclassified Croceitalea]